MTSGWYTSPNNKCFHASELPYMIDGKKVSAREYYLEMVDAKPIEFGENVSQSDLYGQSVTNLTGVE